eukprot:CAMPEP_0196739458 /NCGR_PEP_ID=MMETSP1091-20130531/22821_1 /TAXON_ID=302021 /ORGANISM="Rhodomonas sp., Strain CCMP768" /LENGTH=43 /DNA_ID= /DNA_START= /DNA_END= /DNA_ORIENTATION=
MAQQRHLSPESHPNMETMKLQDTLLNDVLTGESLALELGGGLL